MEKSIEKVTQEEIIKAIKAVTPEKAAAPSEVCAEMLFTGAEIEIDDITEKEYQIIEANKCVVANLYKGKFDMKLSCIQESQSFRASYEDF